MRAIALLLLLTACTTPKTMLVNDKTGQVWQCGGHVSGSLVGGLIGYQLQKSADEQCVDDFRAAGFKEK